MLWLYVESSGYSSLFVPAGRRFLRSAGGVAIRFVLYFEDERGDYVRLTIFSRIMLNRVVGMVAIMEYAIEFPSVA